MSSKLNKAEKLNKIICEDVEKLNPSTFIKHLVRQGARDFNTFEEILDREEHSYWMWLHCLIKRNKPKQVVELGAAFGNSTIMMASVMPKDSKLISVDIGGIQPTWGNVNQYYPSLIPIWGDDLNLKIYPPSLKLKETDIWFIDTLHTAEHFAKELNLYSKFFKKGAIVVCDDIHFNNMFAAWSKIPYDKCDNSFPCHADTGFGVFVV